MKYNVITVEDSDLDEEFNRVVLQRAGAKEHTLNVQREKTLTPELKEGFEIYCDVVWDSGLLFIDEESLKILVGRKKEVGKVKYRMTTGELILLDDIRPVLKDRIEELVKDNAGSAGESLNTEPCQALRAFLVNCLHQMVPDQQLLADLGTMSSSFADGYRYAHLA